VLVTYQVAYATHPPAEPFANGSVGCDTGDVMTGTGLLVVGDPLAIAPALGGEQVQNSGWLAGPSSVAHVTAEGRFALGVYVSHVMCVDMPPLHDG
jgi:hypothetical protein